MQFLYSVFGFVLAIGILVTIHEFGHFWVARKSGVKVLKFSIGFGKPLKTWRRKNDETEYILAAIPLGGYVKMLDERVDDVSEEEKHRAFNQATLAKRTAIVAAGPIANFIFAILAMWALYLYGVQDIKPVVGKVVENSLAADAGFMKGDKLLTVDGRKVHGWEDQLIYFVHKSFSGKTVDVGISRNNSSEMTIPLDFSKIAVRDIGPGLLSQNIGLYPSAGDASISAVVPGLPADKIGMRPGANIISIDGEPTHNWLDVVNSIAPKPDQLITIKFTDGDAVISKDVRTVQREYEGNQYGQIGIYPSRHVYQTDLLEGFAKSVDYTWRFSWVSLVSIGKMFTREVSTENLSGPITIANIAGHTVQSGVSDFVLFLAVISISLGLINLLPIPVLDGGHLLFFAIEAIKGSPVSERVMIWGQQIGIAALLLLMSLAFYNDIIRLIT
ncbi:MAG: regulator of sigma E protease [Gammaproteobacteria bacterium]|jgi:regulator of sigma E protease